MEKNNMIKYQKKIFYQLYSLRVISFQFRGNFMGTPL